MNLFVFSALVAVALAAPSTVLLPALRAGDLNTIVQGPIISQYHSQDELGQYSYGYNGGQSAKSEVRSLDGVTRGAYNYYDADGKLQTVEYTADAVNGFRARASNMPVAPIETRTAPLPVAETAEVAKARADFLIAYEEAKIRAAAEPEKTEEKIEEPTPVTRTITPVVAAPITRVVAPVPVFRTLDNVVHHPAAFSYSYTAPTFGYNPYTLGYPFNYIRSAPVAAPIFPQQFIPQPVAETPEVARARAEHLAAHAAALRRL